jgi:hypothetical protein
MCRLKVSPSGNCSPCSFGWFCGGPASPADDRFVVVARVFFTGGNRGYRWTTVPKFKFEFKLKNEKINKKHQKIAHDLWIFMVLKVFKFECI